MEAAPPVRASSLTYGFARGGSVLREEAMVSFDPLDVEILERAFDGACAAVKDSDIAALDESDEGLEIMLRRELIEIAYSNGVSDPETLRDLVLAHLSDG